jgi:hypothetical protein
MYFCRIAHQRDETVIAYLNIDNQSSKGLASGYVSDASKTGNDPTVGAATKTIILVVGTEHGNACQHEHLLHVGKAVCCSSIMLQRIHG